MHAPCPIPTQASITMPTGLCSVYGHRGTSRLTHHTVAKLRSYNGGGYSMDTYPTLQPSRRRDEEPHHRHHHLLVINVTSLATDNVFDASAELLLWTIEGPSASGLLASYPCLINMPPAHRPASVPHNSGHPSGQLGDWLKWISCGRSSLHLPFFHLLYLLHQHS